MFSLLLTNNNCGLPNLSKPSTPCCEKVKVVVTQLCLTLCDPMDCNLPGSSVHGIFQARTLEWVAIFFYRESALPFATQEKQDIQHQVLKKQCKAVCRVFGSQKTFANNIIITFISEKFGIFDYMPIQKKLTHSE